MSLLLERLPSEQLREKVSRDAHHGSSAIVQLAVLLPQLPLRVPSPVIELAQANAIVAIELGSRPPAELNEPADQENLGKASGRHLEQAADAGADVAELEVVGGGQVPIKDPVIVVDNHAGHCHHSNAPVLPLDSTVALK